MKLYDIIKEANDQVHNNVLEILRKHQLDQLIDPDQIISLCKDCSQYILHPDNAEFYEESRLYRGSNKHLNSITVFTPTMRDRSLTGDNTILNLVSSSHHTNWTNFPNRKFSLFYTNDRTHAGDFGSSISVCIPVNNAIFGLSPDGSKDFNNISTWTYNKVYSVPLYQLTHSVAGRKADDIMWRNVTWEEIKKMSDLIEDNGGLKKAINHAKQALFHIPNDIWKKWSEYDTLYDLIYDGIDPYKNGFDTATATEITSKLDASKSPREAWTDYRGYALSEHEAPTIFKAAKEILTTVL